MADKEGKPIALQLVPSPPSRRAGEDERVKPLPLCVGCGQIHGGVNAGQQCLENEVRRLRAILRALGARGVIPE